MGIRKTAALLVGLALVGAVGRAADDDKPKPAEAGTLVIIDAAGKEQKLKSWKFKEGTRRLGWLAPIGDKPEPKDKDKGDDKEPRGKGAGPEALVLREDNSTNWKQGVVTLIPLAHIKSIAFDADRQKTTVRVATGPKAEDEVVLSGTTEYGDNQVTIEAEVDKGDLGVAEVVYKGGVAKGIKEIRFPPPKADAAAAGRPALVTVADKKTKNNFKALDLQALYRSDGAEKVLPTLMFKKTVKIDFAKVNKISGGDSVGKTEDFVWQVTLKDGTEDNFTLLTEPTIDNKKLQLEGLLARVPGGYRLVPTHTLYEVDFDPAKAGGDEKPKDKEDKPKDKDDKPKDK